MANENSIPQVDYLLLVAIKTEEEKLLEQAILLGLNCQTVEGKFGEYHIISDNQKFRVVAVRTKMGSFLYEGSASKAIYYKSETRATGIICLGMAFGISEKDQKVGDILISTILLPYDNRIVKEKNYQVLVDYEPVKPFEPKKSLLKIFQDHADSHEWKSRTKFGALLTGGARIRSAIYRDQLAMNCVRIAEPVIGGEMEAGGVLSASDPVDPCWIVVKAICDFADGNRDEIIGKTRPVACENSARFVLQALMKRAS